MPRIQPYLGNIYSYEYKHINGSFSILYLPRTEYQALFNMRETMSMYNFSYTFLKVLAYTKDPSLVTTSHTIYYG